MRRSMRVGPEALLPPTANANQDLRLVVSAGGLQLADVDKFQENTLSRAQAATLVGSLAARHDVTIERAQMLVDRFGIGRRSLDGAAHDLCGWKL